MIKKKKNKLINEEDERERCFISNTTMHLVSTDRVRNNLHVSLLFIQGYTSTGNNRVILVHLFFFGFRKKKKKKREKGRERKREVMEMEEERRNIQKNNRYNNFNH